MHSNVWHTRQWRQGHQRPNFRPHSRHWPDLSFSSPCPQQQQHSKQHRGMCCLASRSSDAATHYDVLGVSSTATSSDIKSAYRRLARQLHPDVNKDPGAPAQFVKCNTAYEVLIDDAKRREYDMELAMSQQGATFTTVGFGSMSGGMMWDFMVEVMGDDLRSGARRTKRYAPDDYDSDDSDDELTEEELMYELDYTMWSSTPGNYRSSFTSSWSGANGRKRRAAAEARAQRAAAAAAEAAAAEQAKTRRSRAGRRSGKRLDPDTLEDLLSSFGPEVRVTVQRTFGRNLEELNDVQELIDFVEVMSTLKDDMGIPFEIFNSVEAQDTYHRHGGQQTSGGRTGAAGRRAGSSSTSTTASPRSSPAAAAPGTRGGTGSSRSSPGVVGAAAAGRTAAATARTNSGRSSSSSVRSSPGSEKVRSGRGSGGKKGRGKGNAKVKGSIDSDDPWYYGPDKEDDSDGEDDDDSWVDAWSTNSTKSTASRKSSSSRSSSVGHEPAWNGHLADPFGDLFR